MIVARSYFIHNRYSIKYILNRTRAKRLMLFIHQSIILYHLLWHLKLLPVHETKTFFVFYFIFIFFIYIFLKIFYVAKTNNIFCIVIWFISGVYRVFVVNKLLQIWYIHIYDFFFHYVSRFWLGGQCSSLWKLIFLSKLFFK